MSHVKGTARQVVEALIREDGPTPDEDASSHDQAPAPEPARNPAGGIVPAKLAGFVSRYLEAGASGIEISTHFGDQVLNVIEVWEADGVVKISVAAQPDQA